MFILVFFHEAKFALHPYSTRRIRGDLHGENVAVPNGDPTGTLPEVL